MWNNGQNTGYRPQEQGQPPYGGSSYGSPSYDFPAPGFPSAAPAGGNGYNPAYSPSYLPPAGGPPPNGGGYGFPPGPPPPGGPYGPPPSGPPPPGSSYPGQHHHHHPPGPPPFGQGGMPHPGQGPPPFPGEGRGPPPIPPRNSSGPPPIPQRDGYGAPPVPQRDGYGPPPIPQRDSYGVPPSVPSRPGQFSPPAGPPSRFAPPPGPPPSSGNASQAHYRPPPGPPPGAQGGSYAPPSGPPPRPPAQQQAYGPTFEGANHQRQQPYFQYSQCTGKKKALCIGINYVGQKAELKGCINDARNVQRFLCNEYGYKEDDIVLLTDDARNPRQIPTRENLLAGMQWLVRGAQPNDSLFFHYSGHGGQTKDLDGDEADGYDEVIYPVDFERAGHIVDDIMHDIMVKPLPAGCRLTAIFDSCHSGSALDLPYLYSTEGKVKEPNLAAEAGQGLLSTVTSYARGDMSGVMSSVTGLLKTATGSNQRAEKKARATKTSPADVISWSGCKDSQTSADTFEAGQSTGAMSFAFMSALRQNKQQSYQQLLGSLREILRNKYSQKPQLSSSHPMDTNLLFIC